VKTLPRIVTNYGISKKNQEKSDRILDSHPEKIFGKKFLSHKPTHFSHPY